MVTGWIEDSGRGKSLWFQLSTLWVVMPFVQLGNPEVQRFEEREISLVVDAQAVGYFI